MDNVQHNREKYVQRVKKGVFPQNFTWCDLHMLPYDINLCHLQVVGIIEVQVST